MACKCIEVLAFQTALGQSYLSLLSTTIDCCGAVLDPRPDLAIPARRVRSAYAWWW